MSPKLIAKLVMLTAALSLPALSAFGASDPGQTLHNAYYLETHDKDLAGAVRLYKEVVEAKNVPADVASEASERLASCQEALRAADLAALMPPETILYAELRQPGQHLADLLNMLGLSGNPLDALNETKGFVVPGVPGLVIPQRLAISPALLQSLTSFDGVALAITGIDFDAEVPRGVLILSPGDFDLLRGSIETAAQFLSPAEPVGGFPAVAIQAPDFSATIAFTHRLVVAGTDRALVEGVVQRLSGDMETSLATTPAFTAPATDRDDAMVFAHLDVQNALKIAQVAAQHDKDLREGLMMGQIFFDLAHLDSLSLALGTGDDHLGGELRMSLAEGQMNMVYNLVRTPPMHGRALGLVPSGTAAVLALGLNPDLTEAGAQDVATKTQTVRAITGLDIAREFFANIREVAVFLTPPGDAAPRAAEMAVPDVGLVMVVGDPDKSEALWDFLLSLPTKFTGKKIAAPRTQTIDGTEVQVYAMPDGPSIRVARTDSAIVIGMTDGVMRRTLGGIAQGKSVLDDPDMRTAVSQISDHTCVAVIVQAGRVMRTAAAFAPRDERRIIDAISQTADRTNVSLTIDESPTLFALKAQVSGLPTVEAVMQTLAEVGVVRPADSRRAQGKGDTPSALPSY